jgi:hypothetical protein
MGFVGSSGCVQSDLLPQSTIAGRRSLGVLQFVVVRRQVWQPGVTKALPALSTFVADPAMSAIDGIDARKRQLKW